ncbi:hypothetical protein I3843_06G058200 [Carya illinoinensis]|nr:hypothetical protein I3843_06G058200 [Carya illinoinensis]
MPSLSLSLISLSYPDISMGRGIPFPAGLTLLVALLLLHRICSAKDTHHCAPSSCGDIRNISYPFRLKDDPPNCGDFRYNLSCENNRTVLHLSPGSEFYVKEIDYDSFIIRFVDGGVGDHQDNHSSNIPRYFLTRLNFSDGVPYDTLDPVDPSIPDLLGSNDVAPVSPVSPYLLGSNEVAFMHCEKPVKSPGYLNISACFDTNGVSSSNNSKRYRYIFLSRLIYGDVEESCQVEQMSLSSWSDIRYYKPYYYYHRSTRNFSCADLQEVLAFGFEVSWHRVYCGSCGRHDTCYVDKEKNFYCRRSNYGILYEIYYKGSILTDRKMQYLLYYRDPPSELLMLIIINCGQFLAAKCILGSPFVIAFLIYKWRRRHLSMYDGVEEFLTSHNNLMPIRYCYLEIRKMTKNFNDKLGEGGFGTVFKGTLRSGQLVAVKMLGKSKDNVQDFINEVATIGRIHHVNIVRLIGFCVEGSKRALVYEFMSNGSLNKHIFLQEGSVLLSYEKILDIAFGVARGIEYLHQGCDMQILHFDIKPHNILLDESFRPKVSDFGLAKLYSLDENNLSLTAARGTLGYMAPELFYKSIGNVSYKADVYSFGMLLMEMAGRRKNWNSLTDNSSHVYFPTWVFDQLHNGEPIELEDTTEREKELITKMLMVALWCIQMKPNDRPSMSRVIEMLEGEVDCLQLPPRPFLTSMGRSVDNILDISAESLSSIECGESSQSTYSHCLEIK